MRYALGVEFWFLLIAFVAEIVGTVAGFGSSTIALPLSLFVFDFNTALVLVAFLHIFGNFGRIAFLRRGISGKLLLAVGVPSVSATFLGALLVAHVPREILKGILGVFLLCYTLISAGKVLKIKSSTATLVVGGGISGFLAGLIGTGGALRGVFLNSLNLQKETYVATAAAIALMVDVTRLPIYLGQGLLSSQYYSILPILLLVALLASFIGSRIVTWVPQKIFRTIVLAALFLVGVKFIYDLVSTGILYNLS